MAWANSYVCARSIMDALANTTATTLAVGDANKKIALYNTSFAQLIDDNPWSYSATNEVTGTAWPAGGVALSLTATGISVVAGYGIMFDAVDVSVASTTLATGIYGCVIYDNNLSPKQGICAVYFGATGYTTSNGTFGITWDVNGIFRVQLHP